MFIQTEATPNPATLKFLPGRAVMPDGTLDLRDVTDAERSPLAQRLFGVSGVSGVFLGSDFITVTKSDGEWPHLKPAILGAIMEHFMSGAPVLAAGSAADVIEEGEFFDPADAHAPRVGVDEGRRHREQRGLPRTGGAGDPGRLIDGRLGGPAGDAGAATAGQRRGAGQSGAGLHRKTDVAGAGGS